LIFFQVLPASILPSAPKRKGEIDPRELHILPRGMLIRHGDQARSLPLLGMTAHDALASAENS
jgi:hypothetical protein